MQKVVGSSPIIRSTKSPLRRGFLCRSVCTSCRTLEYGTFLERSEAAGTMDAMAGHKETLVASHHGNVNAVRHGVHSRTGRVLAPRAAELADALMSLRHVVELDRVAADEVGSIVSRLEAIDADLNERGHFGRGGARSLLDHKARLSKELRQWLVQRDVVTALAKIALELFPAQRARTGSRYRSNGVPWPRDRAPGATLRCDRLLAPAGQSR